MWALARYPDKRCGHEVLCNSFRNPAHTAKMIATAQALSGGRAILGIGAGWNEEEYRAYGWPFPPTPLRVAQLGEAIALIRRLWTEAPATYEGEHYRLAGTPAQVTEALQRIVRQGATRLTVNFADAPRPDGTQLFASEVLPEL